MEKYIIDITISLSMIGAYYGHGGPQNTDDGER